MPSINIIYSLSSTISKMLAAILFLAVLSRALPSSDYAVFITSVFVSQLSAILVDGGINNELLSVKNSVSKEFDDRIALTNAIRFILYISISFILSIYYVFHDGLYFGYVSICGFMSSALLLLIETSSVRLKMEYKFQYELKLTAFISLISVVMGCICFISPLLISVAVFIPRLIGMALFRDPIRLFKFLGFVSSKSIVNSFTRLRFFAIDSVASNLNLQLDSIFLLFLFGDDGYALFQPLNKIYQAGIGMSSAVSTYAIPKVHSLYKNKDKLYVLLKIFSFFAVLSSLIYLFLSARVVTFLFGSSFSVDQNVIICISFLILLRYVCAAFGSFLMLNNMQKYRAKVNMFVTVISLPFLFFCDDYFEILKIVVLTQIIIFLFYGVKVYKINLQR